MKSFSWRWLVLAAGVPACVLIQPLDKAVPDSSGTGGDAAAASPGSAGKHAGAAGSGATSAAAGDGSGADAGESAGGSAPNGGTTGLGSCKPDSSVVGCSAGSFGFSC
ncbi:MAG TPA: hypothetical protein VGF76_04755, partial [Polyangiaceae bacterium]